jgi:predicted P-loop ATPase
MSWTVRYIGHSSPETDVALRMRAVLVTSARGLRPGARFVRIDVRQSGQTALKTSAA